MILLPLGHEQETVSRLPWVSFGLMGACLLVFLLTSVGTGVEEEIEEDVGAAIEYFLEHPYLELDPELLRMTLGGDEETAAIQIELLRETVKPDRETGREEQQGTLDRLTETALDAIRSHPFRRFGLVPASPSLLGIVSHMFLHGGWLHLLGNLFFLYLAGPFIEDVWGRGLFAGFYLASGFAAAALHMIVFLDSDVPMIGASGAIAGVMGAFLIRYAATKIQFFYMVGFLVRGTFWAPAWLMLPLWFAQQLFMAGMTSSSGTEGGVGYWAHVGGFAFGAGAALTIKLTDFEERVLRPVLEASAASTVLAKPALEEAQRARLRGAPREAWALLCDTLDRNPYDRDAGMALWDLARDHGWEPQASATAVRLVETELRAGDTDLALQHWFEVAVKVPTVTSDPAVLLRIAEECRSRGHHDWCADAVQRLLRAPPWRTSAVQNLRAAELVSGHDRRLAENAIEAAFSRSDLHPDERERAEALLSELKRAPVGG